MTNGDETTRVRTVGRYHLLEELGRGAMAVVYKGFDPVIGRTVAIKTVAFGGMENESRDLRERLYREACAAGTLSHPNIVTIYDVIEEGGMTAIAMEYVAGQPLSGLIAERAPLPIDEALALFDQIGAALDYAASHKIIHRDIKPANILLTRDGRAKVADFGVARLAVSHLTQTGTVVGSPAYMSPEQIRGRPLDGRSDLFSAVVMLYEMLTKERPFSGDDIATTMYRIVNEAPTPPTQFNPAIGPPISDVFLRALGKNPDERPATCAEFAAEVRRAQAQAAAGMPPVVETAEAPRRWPKLLALASVPVVLVAGFVGWLALSGRLPLGGPAGTSQPVSPASSAQTDVGGLPVAASQPLGEPAALTGVVPATAASAVPPAEEPALPKSGSGAPAEAGPVIPAKGEVTPSAAKAAEKPEESPPLPPKPAPATVRVGYAGGAYQVTVYADGKQVGRLSGAGQSLSIDPGRPRLRAVNEALFLSKDFGSVTLASNEGKTLSLPATASAYIGVRGDLYEGLRILIDGRAVKGPYPAQIGQIAAGRHRIAFRWEEGSLRGVEIAESIDLSDGAQFTIRAIPEDARVAVQKLR